MYRLILNLLSGQLHWVKSVQIRSFSGPYFPAFGLNTERYGVSLSVFSPNAGKYGSELAPYLDTFHVDCVKALINFFLRIICCLFQM